MLWPGIKPPATEDTCRFKDTCAVRVRLCNVGSKICFGFWKGSKQPWCSKCETSEPHMGNLTVCDVIGWHWLLCTLSISFHEGEDNSAGGGRFAGAAFGNNGCQSPLSLDLSLSLSLSFSLDSHFNWLIIRRVGKNRHHRRCKMGPYL